VRGHDYSWTSSPSFWARPELGQARPSWARPGSPKLGSARQRHWTEPTLLTWTAGSSGRARLGSVQPVWLSQMFFFLEMRHDKDR
jgi:hypothetical protein